MAKIKAPKASPTIDMTPMVDLAFLLVTFFMLSANFRSDEPVQVDTPSSIADAEIPKNVIMITVDKEGRVLYGFTGGQEARKNLLIKMADKYKVKFNKKQLEEFSILPSFGCSVQQLPQYLEMESEKRKELKASIPMDSTNNQLKDWIYFGNIEGLASGKVKFEEAVNKNPETEMNEYKPKFILKVDGKALYEHAKNVIEIFRDLDLNNLNFVTSLEGGGEKH